MEPLTKEHLATTLLANVLEPLYQEYDDSQYDGDFDTFLWEHLPELGLQLYQVIGDGYGDVDSAIVELGL